MNNFSPDSVRQILFDTIDSIGRNRSRYLTDSQRNFTRCRKLSFFDTVLFTLTMAKGTMNDEAIDFFPEECIPSASAIIQRRNQIKPKAFRQLLLDFTHNAMPSETFHGYSLIACDGSRLNLPYNPKDPDTFLDNIKNRRGHNQVHINALYDLLGKCYVDALIQPANSMEERKAFLQMFDRYPHDTGNPAVFIADRGYFSYNLMAHVVNGDQHYLFRLDEKTAKALMKEHPDWKYRDFLDEEFPLHVGRRNTKALRALENYHCVRAGNQYDYIERGSNKADRFDVRLLKFPLSETTDEYILTNLPKESFTLSDIKDLYHMRWGIETSFRELKYHADLIYIHSLKKELVLQEIYAKLTLYNFCSIIASHVQPPDASRERKFAYKLNRSKAFRICVKYLKREITNVIKILQQYLTPCRPGRRFKRNMRRQSAKSLTYR